MKIFGDFRSFKTFMKKKIQKFEKCKIAKQFYISIEKKRKFGTGAEIELPYFLPPLDTMSGEVKWQRSVGPYFGYRCSTSVVVKVVVARK